MKKIKNNMILFSLTLLLAGVIAFGAKADVFAADASLSPVQGVKQITHVTSSVSETTAVRVSWDAVPYTASTEESSDSKNSTGSRALPDDLGNLLPDNSSGNKTLADTVLYKVEYCPQGGTWKTFNEAVPYTYATITGLDAGKSYEVRVSAYVYTKDAGSDNSYTKTDLASESAPVVVVTAPAANDKFSFTQTKASTTSVTITYAAVEGANLYEVSYQSANMPNYQTFTTEKTTVTIDKLTKDTITDISVVPCRTSGAYTAKSTTKVSGEVALQPTKPGIKYIRVNKSKKEMDIFPKDNSNRYADGYQYQIYRVYKNKKLAEKTSDKGSYYTYSNKAIGSRDLFKVRVRAYRVAADGTKFYSSWTSWNYCSDYTVTKSAQAKGTSGIGVKWNKVRGAKGYKVYAATKNRDGKYKVVATIKNGGTTKATFNKLNKKALKKNQRYYVYVEPYFKSGKKTIKVNNGYYKYRTLIYKK